MNTLCRKYKGRILRRLKEDFIDEGRISGLLGDARPDVHMVRDIVARSLSLKRLDPEETAALLAVDDPGLWEEMFAAAGEVRNRVYGPRVVIFAPLYCSNYCENSCLYCAFRKENLSENRKRLSVEDVRRETEALLHLGHKRLIAVYGEHCSSGVDYMEETIDAIYKTGTDRERIRRVNVNAPPLSVEDYRRIRQAGIGTYQVFQETYHHATYAKVHPRGPKSDYLWRLHALHLAQEAGIDDVAIGALFGLHDWRFEVMGLLLHTIELEEKFNGTGPHTISFPRLRPASGSPFNRGNARSVKDEDFLKLIAVIRLSVPYTGMIITAREPAEIRRKAIDLGCTQTDASSRIGLGSYSDNSAGQDPDRQQFLLSDTRSLDQVATELAKMGYLTSFCTAGYRCERTGKTFMALAKEGKARFFCMPNAIVTFKEYLLDHASPETKTAGEELIERRIGETDIETRPELIRKLKETEGGKRDLRF